MFDIYWADTDEPAKGSTGLRADLYTRTLLNNLGRTLCTESFFNLIVGDKLAQTSFSRSPGLAQRKEDIL